MKGVSYITDINQPRDPGLNFLIMNTTGTMNQYFAWAGEFAPQVPGSLQYILKGQAPPLAVKRLTGSDHGRPSTRRHCSGTRR